MQKKTKKENLQSQLSLKKQNNFYDMRGITLVALVITIVILIILATVSIGAIFGEDGLISRAQEAKNFQANAEAEENKLFGDAESYINGVLDENGGSAGDVVESDIWKLQKSTNEYSAFVELKLTSKYFVEKPLTLNEYKEEYIVKIANENGGQYNNFDEIFLVMNTEAYYYYGITSIAEYIVTMGMNTTREEFIVDSLHLQCEPEEYADAMLGQLGYTTENIQEIETEYTNEYLPKIDANNGNVPEDVREKVYTITYPDGTEETVNGKDLYKYEGRYTVKEKGSNIVKVTEKEKIDELDILVNNFMKYYQDGSYKYIPLKLGYKVEVLNKELTTYPAPLSEIDGVPVTMADKLYQNCRNLTSLDLRGFDTRNLSSMIYMFDNCRSLKELNLSSFDTSNVISMFGMFNYCTSLTNLDLSSFDTSNVTIMGSMFTGCSSLTELNLSNFNTSNVTMMSGMFTGCSSLTEPNLSSFDTSNVTMMGSMFTGCSSLTELNLSNFNTSNVTDMQRMFSACQNLTKLNLSNFNTSNVTNMGGMFTACSSLTELNLSNFNTSNVTNMGNMFNGCISLTELDLSSFDTSNVTRMNGMFYNCYGLTSLDLTNFDTNKVTDMEDMFNNCKNLTIIYVEDKWTTDKADTTDMFRGCGTDKVTKK